MLTLRRSGPDGRIIDDPAGYSVALVERDRDGHDAILGYYWRPYPDWQQTGGWCRTLTSIHQDVTDAWSQADPVLF